MTNSVEPNDIGKHPNLIKSAQKEISELDVLVCGKCHAVYHHVEAFTEHKSRPCKVDSTLKDCRETKAKVWAFLLWKASQLARMESNTINSWRLYKEWIEQDEDVRQTWIIAGETIQSFAKMGQGSLQEMPMKVTKHAIRDSDNDEANYLKKVDVKMQPRVITTSGAGVQRVIKSMATPGKTQSPVSSPLRQIQQRPGLTIKKAEVTKSEPVLLNKLIANVQNKTFFAKHYDAEENVLREFKVEKILAKRFNPRKRMHEYLVKWAQTEQLESNTWEPQTHLETCEPLLEIFETQLAKQKEARAKLQQQAFDQIKQAPQSTPRVLASRPAITKPNMISRNTFSDEDGTFKRKNLDSDYDTTTEDESSFDTFGNKRFKTGPGGGRTVQSIIGRTANGALLRAPAAAEVVMTSGRDGKVSGVVKKPGISVSPNTKNESAQVRILGRGDATPSGVFKIGGDQGGGKQVLVRQTQQTTPNSGVRRVVSNTNQQTQRQLGRTTVTRIVSKANENTPQQQQVYKTVQKSTAKKISTDEDDDGLPDLFPTEVKIPPPDSPDRPFTLDPLTGAVIGQKIEAGDENQGDATNTDDAKKEHQEDGQQQVVLTAEDTQIQQVMTNEDGTPLLVTGEDGTIYQVAGKNAEGQTILIAQGGEDGEQQCLLMASDDGQNVLQMVAAEGQVVEGQEVALATGEQQHTEITIEGQDGVVQGTGQSLTIQTGDSEDGQITAEVVQADLPSPGGTRRVVLMLPDGSFMMTEVNDEQYQSLNLVN